MVGGLHCKEIFQMDKEDIRLVSHFFEDVAKHFFIYAVLCVVA